MTHRVAFASPKGSNVQGELAEPTGTGKLPGVVIVQEWWGVNDHVRSLAERLAEAGFFVVAPDLYDGKVTKDADEAARWMGELDTFAAVDKIAGAAAFLREHPRASGKVGVMGFCLGGALSFAAACHVEGLSAVVPFYGVPAPEKVDYGKVTAPILAHFAKNDEWATVAKAEAIKAKLEGRGHPMELCVYDAQHAFMNDTRPEVYDAASAKLAWDRSLAFLQKHLG
jgi:carboxymethylenebutenolidase